MTASNIPLKITRGLVMCHLKHFEIIANEELLFPTLFSTAELLFQKFYTQKT